MIQAEDGGEEGVAEDEEVSNEQVLIHQKAVSSNSYQRLLGLVVRMVDGR